MIRRIVLAAASTVCTLVVLEGILRLPGVRIGDPAFEVVKHASVFEHDDAGDYMRYPLNTSFVSQGVQMHFNSLGMRDREPRMPKPAGTFRVLCLGDSHTFGPRVRQDAIYPAWLRATLRADGIDVVAAGVEGWNTVAESSFLEHHIDELAPDLVSLLYVANDTELTEAFDPRRQRNASRVYRMLVMHSRLFEWSAWMYAVSFPQAPDSLALARWRWLPEKGSAAFDPDEPGWLASRDALLRIRDLTRTRGARFVIFLNDQTRSPLERAAWARLTEFGREAGVPVFDTFPFYGGRSFERLMNAPLYDRHQNAHGYALLAKGIARTLREGHFLPR